MKGTCLDIIFIISPFLRQETADDGLIESIMIDVIILPNRIGRN